MKHCVVNWRNRSRCGWLRGHPTEGDTSVSDFSAQIAPCEAGLSEAILGWSSGKNLRCRTVEARYVRLKLACVECELGGLGACHAPRNFTPSEIVSCAILG